MKKNDEDYCTLLTVVFVWLSFQYSMQCEIKMQNNTMGLIKLADCKEIGYRNVPINLPPDIDVIDLTNNYIAVLRNNSFSRYSILIEINLSNNKLDSIDIDAFAGLYQIQSINMSDNSLDVFNVYTPDLFKHLANVTHLDIRRNKPTIAKRSATPQHYPDKSFAVLTKISFLAVDVIPYPYFGPGFKNLQSLKTLKFEYCYLKVLRNNTFEHFSPSLEELVLSGCTRNFIQAETGVLSKFENLIKLNFAESCVHLIQALKLLNVFKNKSMETLILSSMNCARFSTKQYPYAITVSAEMMKYLKTICVEILDLSDNGIVDFEPNSLFSYDRPECITNMNFRGNRFSFNFGIQVIELKSFFRMAVSLKTLVYSYIPVRYKLPDRSHDKDLQYDFADNFILLPKSLETLLINNVISNDFFKAFVVQKGSNLRVLDLSYSFSSTSIIFQPDIKSKLESLILDGVIYCFTSMEMEQFHSYSLKTLIWRDAKLHHVVTNPKNKYAPSIKKLFNKFISLEHLDLAKNELFGLFDDLLVNMKNLTELHLSKNLFESIPMAILKLNSIKVLDFRNNLLTTIDRNTRDWADRMNQKHGLTLSLDNNAFECNCNTLEFIRWLKQTKVKFDKESYNCIINNGTVISTLEAYDKMDKLLFSCNSKLWLTISSLLMATCITGTFLLIVYSKRWEICVFLYQKFRNLIETKLKKQYTYDLYVSYETDSMYWIKTVLLPKVEDEWGLKICLKDRDFLVGVSRFDIEAESIQQSRHVMFIITPSFKNSLDYLFEIERVKYEKMMKNMANIIVIVKDISISDIPIELSYIWNNVSLVQWTENSEQLDIIWQRMKIWLSTDCLGYFIQNTVNNNNTIPHARKMNAVTYGSISKQFE
ncbi:unnamed protein product [Mytilus coruscus]|uniref:TIR domain-containing protein n=1 Tax=Mytilus coruscus TaxID=42192 RepID=A0A6J8B5Y0_MYTCO|nr:unnamed protein product [Mytilus coruscus]